MCVQTLSYVYLYIDNKVWVSANLNIMLATLANL